MKRFKIGFAAIIALLAITVTVASHAGAFKTKAVAADCNTRVNTYDPAASCLQVPIISQTTACNTAQSKLSKFADLATGNELIDPLTKCGEPNSQFCCAKVQTVSPSANTCFKTLQIIDIVCGARLP